MTKQQLIMLYFPYKLKLCKISRKIVWTETELDRIFLNVKGRPVHDQTAVLNAEMATSVEISQIFPYNSMNSKRTQCVFWELTFA